MAHFLMHTPLGAVAVIAAVFTVIMGIAVTFSNR